MNKDIKKQNFKKDLKNLIEANQQINMTSDYFVSSNNSLKMNLTAKSFNMFLTLFYCLLSGSNFAHIPSIFICFVHKNIMKKNKILYILQELIT